MFAINIIASAFIATSSYIFFSVRLLRYLRYFQQEDYLTNRFFAWYKHCRAFDRRGSSIAFLGGAGSLLLPKYGPLVASVICAGMLIAVALREENPLYTGKIKLKMTARAKRVAMIASAIYLAAIFLTVLLCRNLSPHYSVQAFWFAQIFLFQLHPVCLVLANWMLAPYEEHLQSGFAAQAADKINKLKPYVIGITGSYGKTSTKAILGEILSCAGPTFCPPRSVNTYMGVTREIRESLEPVHKFAVIEMAAYQRGSIAKLCKLAPPKAGIITAVGEMHLERFGSREQVYLAKSELAQGVAQDGILVVNGDDEYCRRIAAENLKKLNLMYGLSESSGQFDTFLHAVEISNDGSSKFKIRWNKKDYQGRTHLLGRHMLSNIAAAFTLACALGYEPEFVLAAIRNIKAQSNRLEPVTVPIANFSSFTNSHRPGTVVRLNDAFNSNPLGFTAALEVLHKIPAAGRKVLVTPGMVELGAEQFVENKRAATTAVPICDLVLVVGSANQQALVDGLREGKVHEDKYKVLNTMKDALVYLGDQYLKDGDVVLIENDLTDVYEGAVRF